MTPVMHDVITTPHHLASESGAEVLAAGGNAVDAAVAANLVLGVVMPSACGFGGDLLTMVWDGQARGQLAIGAAPAAATADAVRERTVDGVMPHHGPLPVTVPGAVAGWFDLLERHGTRSFGDLAQRALALARDGFELSDRDAGRLRSAEQSFGSQPAWAEVYAGAADRGHLRQLGLARTIERLAEHGPDDYYRGQIAAAIVETVQAEGGLLTTEDLRTHVGRWAPPISATYRDLEVLELPPPTQGVTALEAFRMLDLLGPLPDDPGERLHLLVEVAKMALVDRHEHVSDPDHAPLDVDWFLADERLRAVADSFDPERAALPPAARPVPGGTVYLCAADADGLLVSLSQSNFMGFGSGVTVPGWGINLHNRGAYFRLDAKGADTIAPGKHPLHTLIPAMALRDGRPQLVFGTMGGDNQVQIHLQLLSALLDDGASLQSAIDAPRWALSLSDWAVSAEADHPKAPLTGLRSRGHEVRTVPAQSIGWAKAIEVLPEGYLGAHDPRTDGAVAGR